MKTYKESMKEAPRSAGVGVDQGGFGTTLSASKKAKKDETMKAVVIGSDGKKKDMSAKEFQRIQAKKRKQRDDRRKNKKEEKDQVQEANAGSFVRTIDIAISDFERLLQGMKNIKKNLGRPGTLDSLDQKLLDKRVKQFEKAMKPVRSKFSDILSAFNQMF